MLINCDTLWEMLFLVNRMHLDRNEVNVMPLYHRLALNS